MGDVVSFVIFHGAILCVSNLRGGKLTKQQIWYFEAHSQATISCLLNDPKRIE